MDFISILGDLGIGIIVVVLALKNRSLRSSLDQEIRERQGAHGTTETLVARQGRALSHHVESNLHR